MIAMVMTYDGMIGRRNVGCCFRVWMGFMKHSMHGVYQTGQDRTGQDRIGYILKTCIN
jgi:hypothetical protein